MPVREQKTKSAPRPASHVTHNLTPASKTNPEKVKAELDGLLDEIDTVLANNAEEFVRSYVQKGGQ